MKKGFLFGYRSFIFFCVLTAFQAMFMFKDINIGEKTFVTWIIGCTVWLGANKSSILIEKLKPTARDAK